MLLFWASFTVPIFKFALILEYSLIYTFDDLIHRCFDVVALHNTAILPVGITDASPQSRFLPLLNAFPRALLRYNIYAKKQIQMFISSYRQRHYW